MLTLYTFGILTLAVCALEVQGRENKIQPGKYVIRKLVYCCDIKHRC